MIVYIGVGMIFAGASLIAKARRNNERKHTSKYGGNSHGSGASNNQHSASETVHGGGSVINVFGYAADRNSSESSGGVGDSVGGESQPSRKHNKTESVSGGEDAESENSSDNSGGNGGSDGGSEQVEDS